MINITMANSVKLPDGEHFFAPSLPFLKSLPVLAT
jgi:hypothetical protein